MARGCCCSPFLWLLGLSLAMIMVLGAWPFVLGFVALCFIVSGVQMLSDSRRRGRD